MKDALRALRLAASVTTSPPLQRRQCKHTLCAHIANCSLPPHRSIVYIASQLEKPNALYAVQFATSDQFWRISHHFRQ